MSAGFENTPVGVEHEDEVKKVGPEAVEGQETAQSGGRIAQPFKLPYENEFYVEFKDVATLKEDRKYSEPVTFGPLKWRLLLFPKGNPSANTAKGSMSAYLDVAEADVMEEGWRLQSTISLRLINQICSSRDVKHKVAHKFHMGARDIGYAAFRPLKDLYEPLEGFYVNNTLKFHVHFRVTQSWVEKPEDYRSMNGKQRWDSKAQTGFVGLQNQGATCYLNSLLQSMYHLPRFRHLVYSIETEPSSSTGSLQRLFWNLEHDDDSVGTTELTKSFGWNIEDIAVQHDVQELLRKLVDKLEEKVKDSAQKGVFEQLFRGTYMDILKCINVDYERRQEIAFCDLSLNVAGCDTLEEALRKFTETETLDGENRYKSEQFGYQDAHKGIKLNTLPPVLHLHLKRFDYQYQNDPPTLEKVNAKQIFPPVLKMGEFLDKPVEDSDETTYDLFGILVHSGSAQAGHYYAFLRPTTEPNWFKFDDSKVSHAEVGEAIDDNFGGDEITEIKVTGRAENTQRFATEKHSSAYMLVYVKRTEISTVFSDARLESEIPFVDRMTKEMEALRISEQQRLEALQYTEIRVFTLNSLVDTIPFDWDGKFTPVLDRTKYQTVSIKHQDLVKHLKVAIDAQLGIPAARQRLWNIREHEDYLYLERPVTVENSNRTIQTFHTLLMQRGLQFHDVFVEVNEDIPLDPVALEGESQPQLRPDEIDDGFSYSTGYENTSAGLTQKGFPSLEETRLVFARFWDPVSQLFQNLGQIFLPEIESTAGLMVDAITPLLQKANLYFEDRLLVFFVSEGTLACSEPIYAGGSDLFFRTTPLTQGAFVTVQYEVLDGVPQVPLLKEPKKDGEKKDGDDMDGEKKDRPNENPQDVDTSSKRNAVRFKLFHQYINFLKSRITVEFHDVNNREELGVPLMLTSEMTMGELLERLGEALQWDPKKISLMEAYAGTLQPKLNQMMVFDDSSTLLRTIPAIHYTYGGPVHLFYDLLDVPCTEARGKVAAKVHFVDRSVRSHLTTLYLAPPVTTGIIVEAARMNPKIKALLTTPEAQLRPFDFDEQRFSYRPRHAHESYNGFTSTAFGLEEIYPEELNAPPGSKLVIIYLLSVSSSRFYTKPTHRPFTLCYAPNETLASIKSKIRERLSLAPSIEIDVFPEDPARHDSLPYQDLAVLSEIDPQHLFCNILAAPSSDPKTDPNPTSAATVVSNTKEKPRNALHLGD